MTSSLDRLECAGLVERRPNPNDRRGKKIAHRPLGHCPRQQSPLP
ncbi:MarR family transcriptional regulator [Rhizobium lusitanum]